MTATRPQQPTAAITVTGGCGTTGSRLVRTLRAAGRTVRAACRHTGFDWARPQTWTPVLAGARAAYVVPPPATSVPPGFWERAAAAGVRRVVLLGAADAALIGDDRLIASQRDLATGGLDWTVLAPEFITEYFPRWATPDPAGGRVLALPLPAWKTYAPVSAVDLAAVAAHLLTDEAGTHLKEVLTIGGPEPLTLDQVAAILSEHAGLGPVQYVPVEPPDRQGPGLHRLADRPDSTGSPDLLRSMGAPALTVADVARAHHPEQR